MLISLFDGNLNLSLTSTAKIKRVSLTERTFKRSARGIPAGQRVNSYLGTCNAPIELDYPG